MRIAKLTLAASALTLALAGCGTGLGLSGRERPDEFAVTRAAPLVVPPDFALTPPAAGQAVASTDARNQAVEALFGGASPRSESEQQILDAAERDRAAPGARSVAGDPATVVVDKGTTTQTILQVPEGDGQEASVQTPQ